MSVPNENAYPHTSSYFYHHHYNTRPSPPTSNNNNNQLSPFHFHTTTPQARALLPDTYQTSEKKKSKTTSPSLVQRISVINFSRRIKSIDKFLQNQLTQRRSLSVPAKKSKARAVPNEYINVRTSVEEVEETRDVDSEGSVGEFLREEETIETVATDVPMVETVATELPMVETYESLSHLNISFDDNSNNNETKDENNKSNCNLEDDQDIDVINLNIILENYVYTV